MPVWGQALDARRGAARGDGAEAAGRRITEIVAYLESIQESD